jgi:hypothetical protein
MNRTRIIKFIVLVASVVLCAAWMMFSTMWIADVRNTEELVEQEPLPSEMMGLSFFEATSFEQTDAFYDTIRCVGYVYNISEATDDDATRSMILNSQNVSYRIQLDEQPLDHVTIVTEELYPNIAQTPKIYSGFEFDFCPLGMRDGLYKIILQVEEFGEPVTRTPTGYVIQKTNGYAELHYRPSELVERIEHIDESSYWTDVGFSNFQLLEDGTLNLAGWGIVVRLDASKQTQLARGDFGVYPWEGTYSWIEPEAQITLEGDEIKQYGLDLAFSSPLALIPLTDDSTIRTTVTVNGEVMRTVVLEAGGSYEVSIPANELPDTDDGLYKIRLSTNGCYNPQAEEGSGDIRDLAVVLTYAGAPFYPSVFDASEDTEVFLEVFDGEEMLGTFSTTKENSTVIVDAYDNPRYYSAGFHALIPDVFADDLKIRAYVKYGDKFYRSAYYYELDKNGTKLILVSDID